MEKTKSLVSDQVEEEFQGLRCCCGRPYEEGFCECGHYNGDAQCYGCMTCQPSKYGLIEIETQNLEELCSFTEDLKDNNMKQNTSPEVDENDFAEDDVDNDSSQSDK